MARKEGANPLFTAMDKIFYPKIKKFADEKVTYQIFVSNLF